MDRTDDRVVVSRHNGAIEYLRRHFSTETVEYHRIDYPSGAFVLQPSPVTGGGCTREDTDRMPGIRVYVGNVGPDDVRGKTVYGNLPLHLAALTREVWAVEFNGTPPRGAEYTAEDMVAAGATLRPYTVWASPDRGPVVVGLLEGERQRLCALLARVVDGVCDGVHLQEARGWLADLGSFRKAGTV